MNEGSDGRCSQLLLSLLTVEPARKDDGDDDNTKLRIIIMSTQHST